MNFCNHINAFIVIIIEYNENSYNENLKKVKKKKYVHAFNLFRESSTNTGNST